MKRPALVASLTILGLACSRAPSASKEHVAPEAPDPDVTLSILGTNDVHGHLASVPLFGGFVRALREAKGSDAVLVLDAGDMFQGTLESNLSEGAGMIRAYDALGVDAAALGNHEFDYGPIGPSATPKDPSDDPRGALEARLSEAKFPLLSANLVDTATGKLPAWQNLAARVTIVKRGIKVAVVGVTTEDTPRTTIAANFAGLRMTSIAEAITREATAARREGASVVIVVAHAGGKCEKDDAPAGRPPCSPDEEIMRVLRAVPRGTIDALVAGHTHARMANVIEGAPVIESYSNGKAFGRIDLTVHRATMQVIASHVFPPTELALPADYEGRPVARDEAIAAAIAPDLERARARKEKSVGVHLDGVIARSHDTESAEGNLFADLMRAAQPSADVALTNGGGLRADLPAGDLNYGELFEAMPFDNRFAMVKIRASTLRKIFAANLVSKTGILSISGLRVRAVCRGSELEVTLERPGGRAVLDDETLLLVTTDFLATGGDGSRFDEGSVTLTDTLVRDAFEAGLHARGGHIDPNDPKILDRARPRMDYPGSRPVHCGR